MKSFNAEFIDRFLWHASNYVCIEGFVAFGELLIKRHT